jgi:Transposase
MGYRGGLDRGSAGHAVCVIDDRGQAAETFAVEHTAAGIADMLARLARVAPPAELPIAIERPSGLVVDALIEVGHPVVPIPPNVVKACRPRYRAAAAKSDPSDAYMLADILRTDGHRFRPLEPCADEAHVAARRWRCQGAPTATDNGAKRP